jgi:hypothetical protein
MCTYIVMFLKMTVAVKADEWRRKDTTTEGPTRRGVGDMLPTRPPLVHTSHPSPADRSPSPTIIRPSELSRVCTLSARVRTRVLSQCQRGRHHRRCYINGQRLVEIEHWHSTDVPARITGATSTRTYTRDRRKYANIANSFLDL